MKMVYSTREDYLPAYPGRDSAGWYTEVEDDEFETYLEQGKVFEKDGRYYSDIEQLGKKPEKPPKTERSGMFDNPGGKMKSIVMVLFVIGCVASLISGIFVGAAAELSYGFDFVSCIVNIAIGVFGTYIFCLIFAAIGDIAVNIREINRKTK